MAYVFPYMEAYLVLCSLIYLSYVVVALRIILVLVVYLGGGAHECGIPERPEKGAGSMALWLQVVVSHQCGNWESNTGPFQGQQVTLAA